MIRVAPMNASGVDHRRSDRLSIQLFRQRLSETENHQSVRDNTERHDGLWLFTVARTCYVTSDVEQRQQRSQNNRWNEHNSDKTKKNLTGSYTEVNP